MKPPGPPPVPRVTGPIPPRPAECNGPDDYYDPSLERWIHYPTADDLAKLREAAGGGGVISAPVDYFKFDSTCLPQKYPYHEQVGGTFGPNGECRFNNRREVERTLDHARANGEKIVYPGRGGVNRNPD